MRFLTLVNGFSDNTNFALNGGGGIWNGGVLTVDTVDILDCSSSEGGAGIFTEEVLQIHSSRIEDCIAEDDGAGICIDIGFATVSGTRIFDCDSTDPSSFGGGIAVQSNTSCNVISTEIAGCDAGSGGGIAVDDGVLNVFSWFGMVKMYFNTADEGAGIFNEGVTNIFSAAPPNDVNIWWNFADSSGGGIHSVGHPLNFSGESASTVVYSNSPNNITQ